MIKRWAMGVVIRAVVAFSCLSTGGWGVTAKAQDASNETLGVIFAVGDIMQCNEFKSRAIATADLIRNQIGLLAAGTSVRVVLLGDLAYPKGAKKDFECFAKHWESKVRAALRDPETEILPIPGNHEYLAPPRNASEFFKNFANNAVISAARSRTPKQAIDTGNFGYFSSRFPDKDGGWLLLGLNSHLPNSSGRSAQYAWLTEELKSTFSQATRCVLAFWHDPVFSSGAHGHDGRPSNSLPKRKDTMFHSYKLLYQTGASIVLNGHDHNYEQFVPHNPDGRRADDGLRSFVVGTGGNYALDKNWKRWPEITDGPMEKKVDGVLKLTLYHSSYEWEFVLARGTLSGERRGRGTCNARKPLS